MIEDRKHFIMRMQMMIQEIRMSNLDDACIHSMIEFQLRQRDREVMFKTKVDLTRKIELSLVGYEKKISVREVRKLSNKWFDELIDKI